MRRRASLVPSPAWPLTSVRSAGPCSPETVAVSSAWAPGPPSSRGQPVSAGSAGSSAVSILRGKKAAVGSSLGPPPSTVRSAQGTALCPYGDKTDPREKPSQCQEPQTVGPEQATGENHVNPSEMVPSTVAGVVRVVSRGNLGLGSPTPPPVLGKPPHRSMSRAGNTAFPTAPGRERGRGGGLAPREAGAVSPALPTAPGHLRTHRCPCSRSRSGSGPGERLWDGGFSAAPGGWRPSSSCARGGAGSPPKRG